jgi:tRNA G46 methylase TrmB
MTGICARRSSPASSSHGCALGLTKDQFLRRVERPAVPTDEPRPLLDVKSSPDFLATVPEIREEDQRNRDFILDVLRDVLPTTGVILEIASGSGEHIVHIARNFPALVFQPSDPEPDVLLSVAASVKAADSNLWPLPSGGSGVARPLLARYR